MKCKLIALYKILTQSQLSYCDNTHLLVSHYDCESIVASSARLYLPH